MLKFFKSKKVIVTSVVVIILIVIVTKAFTIEPLSGIVTVIFKPIQLGLYKTGQVINDSLKSFTSLNELKNENDELNDRIANLTTENFNLKKTIEQNDILHEELEFINELHYEYISAKIIGRNPDSLLKTIIINKGNKNEISVNQPVITGKGILIGKVIEANDYISKVLLLSDSQSLVSGTINNTTRGLITGEHGISLKMTLIPQDQNINKDDVVVTSGLENKIPPDLIIGNVEKITQIEGELFKTATIKPLVSYDNISIVNVLKFQ